jgi:hypothetical protein
METEQTVALQLAEMKTEIRTSREEKDGRAGSQDKGQ